MGGPGGGWNTSSQKQFSNSASEYGPTSTMLPGQMKAAEMAAPEFQRQGMEAFRGQGLSTSEQLRQKESLSTGVSDFAGGMRDTVSNRAAALGQRGGAVEGAMKNIDAAKVMGYASGLRDLESMNEQMKQQKISNLMSFISWQPATAQRGASLSQSAGQSNSFGLQKS